jgi:NADH dehydrogenase/NADH:ubiquinone oxidoreductase subunit G
LASIYINGSAVHFSEIDMESYSVLQHCELARIDIPRFCYHDQLTIAGNCRICLVEVTTANKPVVSCATEIVPGMEIFTNTALIKQARESVLEFLLINHPLDCPICDQGGECDLQDLSYVFGSDSSRFGYDRRVVSDKYFGPLVKSIMTRCIHCTRCVRFFDEVLGSSSIGTLGRGYSSEVGSFVTYNSPTYGDSSGAVFNSHEIVGNVIDLCPVGALTSKPFSFRSRP